MLEKKWELTIEDVKGLLANRRVTLYDATVRLVDVWNDEKFRAFHNNDLDKCEKHLSDVLADESITFSEAHLVLKYYPDRKHWENNKLREMLAGAINSENERLKALRQPAVKRSTVSRREYEDIVSKVDRMHSSSEELRKENFALRQENQRLRTELDKARGKIEMLEQMLETERTGSNWRQSLRSLGAAN